MEVTTQEIFAERFKQKYKERRLSREDIADKLGVSEDTVDKWAAPQGQMPKTLLKLVELAKLLHTNIDYLCGLSWQDTADADTAKVERVLGLTPQAQNTLYNLRRGIQPYDHTLPGGYMPNKQVEAASILAIINSLIEYDSIDIDFNTRMPLPVYAIIDYHYTLQKLKKETDYQKCMELENARDAALYRAQKEFEKCIELITKEADDNGKA